MIRQVGEAYRIEGAVTYETVAALLEEGLKNFQGPAPTVDFGAVGAVDSAALSLMLEWTRQLESQGRRIAFTNLGASLTSLSRLYGIAELIPIAAE
jgi:phospholipid transport system transporter-binding protein